MSCPVEVLEEAYLPMLRAAHSAASAHTTQRHGDRALAVASSELVPSLTSFSAFAQETVQFLQGNFLWPTTLSDVPI